MFPTGLSRRHRGEHHAEQLNGLPGIGALSNIVGALITIGVIAAVAGLAARRHHLGGRKPLLQPSARVTGKDRRAGRRGRGGALRRCHGADQLLLQRRCGAVAMLTDLWAFHRRAVLAAAGRFRSGRGPRRARRQRRLRVRGERPGVLAAVDRRPHRRARPSPPGTVDPNYHPTYISVPPPPAGSQVPENQVKALEAMAPPAPLYPPSMPALSDTQTVNAENFAYAFVPRLLDIDFAHETRQRAGRMDPGRGGGLDAPGLPAAAGRQHPLRLAVRPWPARRGAVPDAVGCPVGRRREGGGGVAGGVDDRQRGPAVGAGHRRWLPVRRTS